MFCRESLCVLRFKCSTWRHARQEHARSTHGCARVYATPQCWLGVALRKITPGDRGGVCGSWDTPTHYVGLLSSVHTPPHLLPVPCIYLRTSRSPGLVLRPVFPGIAFLSFSLVTSRTCIFRCTNLSLLGLWIQPLYPGIDRFVCVFN